MENRSLKQPLLITGLIILAICSRFLPIHNFTAVGAVGLFGATYLKPRWLAFAIPFGALWLSDLFLNNVIYSVYYDSFQWYSSLYIYVAFFLVILLGHLMLKKITTSSILASSFGASLIFFLITNFGVWMQGGLYTKDSAGLWAAFAAGVPFFWSTLAGNAFFSLVLFKGYQWITRNASIKETI